MTDDAVRDLAAIRRGVEGRDPFRDPADAIGRLRAVSPRGPSATELHDRAIAEAVRRATVRVPDHVSWRHSFACGIHYGDPCTCKDDAA